MSPRVRGISTLGFQLVVLFGMCRRRGLAGGSISLEVGFEGLKIYSILRLFALFPDCSSRCKFPDSSSSYHAFILLSRLLSL